MTLATPHQNPHITTLTFNDYNLEGTGSRVARSINKSVCHAGLSNGEETSWNTGLGGQAYHARVVSGGRLDPLDDCTSKVDANCGGDIVDAGYHWRNVVG